MLQFSREFFLLQVMDIYFQEKRSNDLKQLKEECLLEKQEAVLHEQEIAAVLRKELEDLKQVFLPNQ